jgi:hypothetical protein
MQNLVSGLRGTPLPRTPVNRGCVGLPHSENDYKARLLLVRLGIRFERVSYDIETSCP